MNRYKNLIIIILIATLIFTIIIRENQHVKTLLAITEKEVQREEARLETYRQFTENYNELQNSYNELYQEYGEFVRTKGFYEGWEKALCSAYTSLDLDCDSYSAIGVNIEKLSQYFNFCAIDPDGDIDYGDIILIKIDYDIIPFLAVDCGVKIKDLKDIKRLDLYFVNDLQEAYRWGMKELDIKVIK